MYVGELHPFKQYLGSKAKFETKEGEQTVKCFNHSISEFTHSAKNNGFNIVNINEYFDGREFYKIYFKRNRRNRVKARYSAMGIPVGQSLLIYRFNY